MTDCQRYLEDPEANAAHLETCAECRAIAAQLSEPVEHRPIAVDAASLPLAPWEGASHRPWPLVAGGALAVVAIALALCAATGTSLQQVGSAALGSLTGLRTLINGSAQSLRAASAATQLGFVIVVVGVNGLLFALLRRAPRGIDA